jgi:hypothetical protein
MDILKYGPDVKVVAPESLRMAHVRLRPAKSAQFLLGYVMSSSNLAIPGDSFRESAGPYLIDATCLRQPGSHRPDGRTAQLPPLQVLPPGEHMRAGDGTKLLGPVRSP